MNFNIKQDPLLQQSLENKTKNKLLKQDAYELYFKQTIHQVQCDTELQLTKSMVLAYRLEASSHHVSHHSHSCGNDFIATWWIMLFGRSCNSINLHDQHGSNFGCIYHF
jgi:hypothetical protein